MATRFDDWESEFLAHHGVKGQKWGVRRYQNPDGTLTAAGQRRLGRQVKKLNKLGRKADIETQRQISEKYKKRAKIGAGVTAALASAAAGSRAKENYWARFNLDTLRPQYKTYHRDQFERLEKESQFFSAAGARTVTKILGAATLASGGYTVYATARSKIAKNRTTEKGHAKAVEKWRTQYTKFVDQLKDVPYPGIVIKPIQHKKKNT